jgi:hypothetical protein
LSSRVLAMLPALCGEGSPTYLFQRRSIPSSASGEASIGFLLLIAADYREMRIVGLLHPDAANPFNPQWLPMIPFREVRGGAGRLSHPGGNAGAWLPTMVVRVRAGLSQAERGNQSVLIFVFSKSQAG